MVKETKLYDLLGVSPSASDAEIKKGYRKMALKFHPDKPTGDTEKFKEISEAFDVLSNGDKREVYDQYGLEAARGNGPMPGQGGNPFGGAGAGGSPFGGFGGHGGFSQADAFNIFSQFSQNGGFGGDDMFGGAQGFGGGMPGGFGGHPGAQRRREPEIVSIQLPCSLEDLFSGVTKKMKLNRKGPNGEKEQTIIEIKLKPGWKAGTKIKFTNQGDYQPDGQRQTIEFVIQEKLHAVFKRDDNNLKLYLPLSFKESLLGFSREVTTIDGRRIPLTKTQSTQPNSSTTYPGLGMPISKQPGQRGDMEIFFKVDYPISLTPEQREAVAKYF